MQNSFEVFLEKRRKDIITGLRVTRINNKGKLSKSLQNLESTDSGRTLTLTENRLETVTSPIPSSFITLNENEDLISTNNNDNQIRCLRSPPNTSFQVIEISSSESSPENSDDECITLDNSDDENSFTNKEKLLTRKNYLQEDLSDIQVTENNNLQEIIENTHDNHFNLQKENVDKNVGKKEKEVKIDNINNKVEKSTEDIVKNIPTITLHRQDNENDKGEEEKQNNNPIVLHLNDLNGNDIHISQNKKTHEYYNKDSKSITQRDENDIEKTENEKDSDRIIEEFSHISFYTKKEDLSRQKSNISESSSAASSNGSVGKTSSKRLTNREQTNSFLSLGKTSGEDMSPWVTDLFFLNFPGYYEEERRKERDRLFREECQKDFKKQSEKPVKKPHLRRTKITCAESENKLEKSHSCNRQNHEKSSPKKTEKTEKEIIVNNPFYAGASRNFNNIDDSRLDHGSKLRCLSARERAQMDLKHIKLSDMLNTNACDEEDRRRAELHEQMQREWLETLERQIQEKKEQKRIENERLAKLDKLLERRQTQFIPEKRVDQEKPRRKSEPNKENGYDNENNSKLTSKTAVKSSTDVRDNRVYSYFRNSAGYKSYDKYSRPDLQEDSDDYSHESKQNETVKSVESFGLNTLTIPRRSENVTISIATSYISQKECNHKVAKEELCQFCNNELKLPETFVQHRQQTLTENNVRTRKDSSTMTENRLLCTNCNNTYLICKPCKDVYSSCSYCKQDQNICHHCVGNYCTNCGKSIRGEQITITSRSDAKKQNKVKNIHISKGNNEKRNKITLEPSFKILEKINCTENNESDTKRTNLKYPESIDVKSPSYVFSLPKYKLNSNSIATPDSLKRSPKNYSTNISRNSLFHPDHNKERVRTEKLKTDKEEKVVDDYWDDFKRTTNNKVVEYFDNYGDLFKNNSSNKVSHTPRGRDDAPIIPFSIDSIRSRSKNREREVTDKFTSLRKKWEVPAVQRQIISNNSPKVLTQLGAIRKQLQEKEFGYDY